MRLQVPRRATGRAGFTLVENVVSLAIVGIVLAAVAAMLVFANNMMLHQQAVSNAQTLASTVKTSIEGALDSADSGSVTLSSDSSTISFKTAKKTAYLGNAGRTYTLAVGTDGDTAGHVTITAQSSGESGELLPASTYIDGDTVSWQAGETDGQLQLTVSSASGAELAATTIDLTGGTA